MALLLIGSLIWLGAIYQVEAAPPQPIKGPTSTPGPLAGEQVVVKGRSEVLPRPRMTSLSLEAQAIAMSQDFEGAWPAPGWEATDLSDFDGGEYFWGKRNCHPRTGNFGGWSVGSGAQGTSLACSDEYPNDAYSWAVYGPFDLSNATAANLTYHYWGSTEGGPGCPFDYLFVGSSIDNQTFSNGNGYCGDWTDGTTGNGYHQDTLDLSNRLGQSQVWIGFVFNSDGSISDIGITIDDISLNVTQQGTSIPVPPNPLTAISISKTQINLSWQDNNNNEVGFKLERSPNGANGWVEIATVGANVTSYQDKDRACGTAYHYRVRAYNGVGPSGYSNTANATTFSCGYEAYLPLISKFPTPTPTPPPSTPIPGQPANGHWIGTTSRGYPMSFDVSRGSTWSNFTLKTNFSTGLCSGTFEITVSSGTITNKQFSYNSSTFSFSGQFNSSTTASGTYRFTNEPVPPCSTFSQFGTWTAQKQ
jgi:hypothetical protein